MELERIEAAIQYLAQLSNGSDKLTFQTFDDVKDRQNRSLIKILHGSLQEHMETLAALNEKGAGIFCTINETDGTGRKGENITKARALVADFDNERPERLQDLQTLEIIHGIKEPSLVVESSHGKHHAYWLCDDLTPEQYTALQVALFKTLGALDEFKGDAIDTTLKDKAKVIRVVGFKHQKDPASPFITRIVHNSGRRYTASQLADMLQPSLLTTDTEEGLPAVNAGTYDSFEALANTQRLNISIEELEYYLELIQCHDYEQWVKVGMALHHETGGSETGLKLWDKWSQGQPKYNGYDDLLHHWRTFDNSKADPVRAATLRHLAQKSVNYKPYLDGWQEVDSLTTENAPVTPYPMEAWRGHLRDAVEAIAYYAQVPEAVAGQCVLGALAHMGQPFINAPMGHGHKPVSLILLTESATGGGKTQAMALSHKAIEDFEKERYLNFTAAHQFWSTQARSLKGKELAEYKSLYPEPKEPTTVFGDTTIEPVLDKFIDGDITNGSWSTDEAGQFFGGHTMKGDTALNALSALTTLWSNGTVTRMRSKRSQFASAHTKAYDVRLTMFLMGQRVVLERALNDPEMNGQGFLARALISSPEDLRGKRVWNDKERNSKNPYNDPRLTTYWSRCDELLKVDDFENDLTQRYDMPFENTATADYFYNCMQAIEERMARGKQYEFLKGYASRMAENASRIAALMAHFDKRGSVTISDLERSFKLVEYSTVERLRYIDTEDTGEQSDVEKLSSWLVSKVGDKQPPRINRSVIYNGAPKPMRKDSRKLDEVLGVLESAGHIRQEIEGGRRKVIYINPYLIK